MKMLNRMPALLSIATLLLCLAGGCGNNSNRDNSMTGDTATFSREPDVAEPIDTNMPGDLRDKTGKDSLQVTPPVP